MVDIKFSFVEPLQSFAFYISDKFCTFCAAFIVLLEVDQNISNITLALNVLNCSCIFYFFFFGGKFLASSVSCNLFL